MKKLVWNSYLLLTWWPTVIYSRYCSLHKTVYVPWTSKKLVRIHKITNYTSTGSCKDSNAYLNQVIGFQIMTPEKLEFCSNSPSRFYHLIKGMSKPNIRNKLTLDYLTIFEIIAFDSWWRSRPFNCIIKFKWYYIEREERIYQQKRRKWHLLYFSRKLREKHRDINTFREISNHSLYIRLYT